MGPTWVLQAPDGPHVGPMNLAIRDMKAGSGEMGILLIPHERYEHTWLFVHSSFRLPTKETSMICIYDFEKVHRLSMDSPHKGPKIWKTFPIHNHVVQLWSQFVCIELWTRNHQCICINKSKIREYNYIPHCDNLTDQMSRFPKVHHWIVVIVLFVSNFYFNDPIKPQINHSSAVDACA